MAHYFGFFNSIPNCFVSCIVVFASPSHLFAKETCVPLFTCLLEKRISQYPRRDVYWGHIWNPVEKFMVRGESADARPATGTFLLMKSTPNNQFKLPGGQGW